MNSERWQKVEEVLQVALDYPPPEREALLEEVCAGDEELKSEAGLLMRAFEEAGEFLEQPAIAQDARVLIGELPDDNIGRVVGPYRIIELLGAGGMSEVYLSQDTRLGRLVALKILPAYFVSDQTRLNRFQREARAASALNHPNVLTIHEVGASDDVHFIATEFIDGQTIRELILQQSLSIGEVVDISVQVASGLAVAHAAGIIHRDIKPENIMRRDDRIVKILDFGIAKLTEQLPQEFAGESPTLLKTQTEVGLVMGTVGYMSPEQARALAVDERTDIWSFGCVLYEMLTGRAPFKGATRLDTLVAILEREPPPFIESAKDAPAPLERLQQIIARTLRKQRSERHQTTNELLADLKSVQEMLGQMTQRERQSVSEHLRAIRRLASDDEKQGAPVSATAETELAGASSSQAVAVEGARHPSRGSLFAVLAAALLVVLFAGVFLYKRLVATRRAADNPSATAAANTANKKLYRQMSEAEQLAFVEEQAQRISAMMGEHPAKLSDDARRVIKRYVDRYVARTGSLSSEYGKEDLRVIYARAPQYIPLIARSFSARKVPVIIGIYLPMIEAEYKPCFENSFGAKGLFQFLPQTARHYGVAPAEMCDVEKMTPAAAHYIADRMAELGDDAESMTLVLLSYNRGAEWVRDTLRQLRETDNYERNFWTLFARRDQLDESFRQESAGYVPAFFATAIIGENPHNFELQIPPLSTLTNAEQAEATKPE
ncbi:MAG TPA: serine/threonine-protein kinase [Pyrinomonadaceae bacterium]|jgi:serine/threonine protein kinase